MTTALNTTASKLLLALNVLASGYAGRSPVGIYAGTVPAATVAKRRAKNRAAKKARRAGRA